MQQAVGSLLTSCVNVYVCVYGVWCVSESVRCEQLHRVSAPIPVAKGDPIGHLLTHTHKHTTLLYSVSFRQTHPTSTPQSAIYPIL